MIELAWLWLRHQPNSTFSVWFRERVGTLNGLAATFYTAGPEQLMASWEGLCELRQSLGVAAPRSPDEVKKRVRYAVDTLIRAWSTAPQAVALAKTRLKQRRSRR